MQRRLLELPEAKEKRILVSGEGQEALLVTYFLARHKTLLSSVPNLKIYVVHKDSIPRGDTFDADEKQPHLGRVGFWLRFSAHSLAQRVHELTFFTYLYARMSKFLLQKKEAENFLPPEEEVPLDGITMSKNGHLMADQTPLRTLLEQHSQVEVVDGSVQYCARFGTLAQHADIQGNKSVKGLRADAFVLCSSYFLLTQLNELRNWLPIVRAPTELVMRTNTDLTKRLLVLNGPSSTLTPDNLPLMGRSRNLTNLYYFTGFSSGSLAIRVQAAKQFAHYFADGTESTIQGLWNPERMEKQRKKVDKEGPAAE